MIATCSEGRAPWVGQSVRRKEDAPLVTGHGRYVADIHVPGTIEVAFLRSSIAHARITAIDTSAALALPGVVAVVTGADITETVLPFTRFVDQESTPAGLEQAAHPVVRPCPMEVLASERVRYVGEPVAAVVAVNRGVAEDGAEQIDVTYDSLPVVTDPERAVQAGSPRVHDAISDNVQAAFEVEAGDVKAAFAAAPHTKQFSYYTQRQAACPMETRGVLATYTDVTDELTIWTSSQTPYMVRTRIAEQLVLAEEQIRVIAPDMGGGFGPKVQVYPEEVLLAYLARTLGKPIRWIEDRQEHLVATAHSRDQMHTVDVAFDDSGVITAIRDEFLLDCGAYNPFSITCAYNSAAHFRSVYQVPNFLATGRCVLTNKTPNVPYRGAGRPEAAFAMDRAVYQVARYLDLDPLDTMTRNLVPPEAMPYPRGMPYRDGQEIVYDCGDFPAALQRLRATVGYDEYQSRRQRQSESPGTRRGIGFASYIEGTGLGPYEGAVAMLDSMGRVVVHAGCTPHGQSHETSVSQVVADVFGLRPEQIVFAGGDTSLLPNGVGTFASRTAVVAGSAALLSARRLEERVRSVASEMLEVSSADLIVDAGYVQVRGDAMSRVSLAQVYRAALPGPHSSRPDGTEPGTRELQYFVPPTVTFGAGFLAATVSVDIETGAVVVEQIDLIHDCGRIINPVVVEGQVQGGVLQGVGAALYESLVYDDNGQPLTTTFMDYLLPTSAEAPPIRQTHITSVSDRNPLGVKGVGEAGTIAPPAAIANAVADALRPCEVEVNRLPLSPPVVIGAIDQAGGLAEIVPGAPAQPSLLCSPRGSGPP
jgi:carbon-monoxide dehydrogenase large subunit